ncbi:MAG: NAD-dependent epimerase/dehydratase family protein [Hyphomicrobiales bacterium]
MDPIAITGGTGFAGRHVVSLLAREERPIRLLVRRPSSAPDHSHIEIVRGSLEDKDSLERLVKGAAAMIHIAGAIAARSRAEFFAVNAEGAGRVAKAAAEAGVSRFVHISSIAAREPPLSDYGASKRAGEDLLRAYGSSFALTILRPPVIYGPGDRTSLPLIAELTHRIAFLPGSPDARFSLIHVRDFARAAIHAADHGPDGLHEIDDGGEGYSWPGLVRIASEVEGRPITPVYLPRRALLAVSAPIAAIARVRGRPAFLSPDKVRQLYHKDWVCRSGAFPLTGQLRFREGFGETVRWYRKQGWLRGGNDADRSGEGNGEAV